ncbi:MAG: type II toxin-antitoxin system RelE/ParE family toxin [bacterium]
MEIKFKNTFLKDLEKLPKDIKEEVKTLVFRDIPKLPDISQIGSLKKIKGKETFYRIRTGDYRLGFEFKNKSTLVFYRVLHRKDIYRYFP